MGNQYPTDMSQGLGRLTPEVLNNVFEAARWVDENKRDLEKAISLFKKQVQPLSFFMAEITGSTAIYDPDVGTTWPNRYIYEWPAVTVEGVPEDVEDYISGITTTLTLDLESTDTTRALNIMEMSNTAEDVGPGVDLTTNYPAGFSMKPVSDGSWVMMFWNKAASSLPVFCVENAHQGPCS